MSLISKLKKNSRVKLTDTLSDSKVFDNTLLCRTEVPMIDVALSGKLDGGLTAGLGVLAGPSKHFKTSFALLMAAAHLRKNPEAVLLFYDSEFGSPEAYFETFGIDPDRVVHTPITNIEELKFDIINQFEGLDRTDDVIVIIDSVGNLASKKEVEDAKSEKSVADMTRAKALKSLFRMCTPYLMLKQIPLLAINHTYKEQGLYPKDIVSGGCLVEGTKLQTSHGLKTIEDFNVGEKVFTVDGEGEVTAIWNPNTLEDGEPECYEIEFDDGYVVTVSDKHMFLTESGWVRADNLTENTIVKVAKVINTSINEKEAGVYSLPNNDT